MLVTSTCARTPFGGGRFSFAGGRGTIGGDAALSHRLLVDNSTRRLYFSGDLQEKQARLPRFLGQKS
jgi:hypothetical protein